MVRSVFRNRREAGRVLARLLEHYRDSADTVVLALPRGGVPVGYEVAAVLGAPLDVLVVRKLGAPEQPELAVGAIASGGVLVTNDDVLRAQAVAPEALEQIILTEGQELARRERVYRGDRAMLDVTGRTVLVVDDGLATGATMNAAIEALHRLHPARVVVAVPAAPESTCVELRELVDEVICASTPAPFIAVGNSYWDFEQTTDAEVRDLLARAPAKTDTEPDDGDLLRRARIPAPGGTPPDDILFDLVGDARLVLIGEASHGTDEFYTARAAMTRRLVEEKGFRGVAVEADWPDAYRVNRYVRGQGTDRTAEQALRGFRRFPAWMWRNTVVRDFAEWLRGHNSRCAAEDQVGFYGLDLYSMHRSAEEVIAYLDRIDPAAAQRARERYSCLEHHADEYGFAAAFGAGQSCHDQVVAQLTELQRQIADEVRLDGVTDHDELFYAEQNACSVLAAEEYYRSMFGGRVTSWNLRDRHMFSTLIALREHLGAQSKIIVWAHNSHLGDARATEMSDSGELNLGQLVRADSPDSARLLGFTTYTGSVTAAEDWGGPARRMRVNPALYGSVEHMLHQVGAESFLVRLDSESPVADRLRSPLLERAIGVVYRPQTERRSHYFFARPADQFDALIHIEQTTALLPLDRAAPWDRDDVETYPYAV
ncbi:erythromycin esterase family protein [Nocardia sp. NBC_00881]|uniref:erythromycin esterase family protein n=1 Tax=Nocardia sp. NBC_00881 TaxID=2975995 RepID=UPI003865980D|nr:erythromycin esterase family protein [Nocardia sp. NBC_00881]